MDGPGVCVGKDVDGPGVGCRGGCGWARGRCRGRTYRGHWRWGQELVPVTW